MSADQDRVFQDEDDQRRAMDVMDQLRELSEAFGKRLEEAKEMVAEQEADKINAELGLNRFLWLARQALTTDEEVDKAVGFLKTLGVSL